MEQNCHLNNYLRKTILNFGFYILIFGYLSLKTLQISHQKLPHNFAKNA